MTNISDDILIWGDTAEQHDTALHELLTRCQTVGIRLNGEKLQYKQTMVKLHGHVLTNKGLQADPSNIDAIVQMPPTPDVKSLQICLGLVNYMARFQLSLSIVLRPLRDLMKAHVDYVWSTDADNAFNDIKCSITQAPILQLFDPKKETIIQSDASMNGLGCTRIHEGKNSMLCFSFSPRN